MKTGTPAPQHEITTAGPLLDAEGRVREPGFSRRPLQEYDPGAIRLTPLRALDRARLKEWDFYAITTAAWSLSLGLAHGGVLGVAFAQLIDFDARRLVERVSARLPGRWCALPRSSREGDVRFARGGIALDLLVREGRRELRLRWPRFDGEDALALDAVVEEPSSLESITVSTPIGARGFYFNRKMCGARTSGALSLGARRHDLAAGRALAVLDWGRGVWPYRTLWRWASGAGFLADGRVLGINLGDGFGDLRAATENAIFLEGRMSKLGRVALEHGPGHEGAEQAWRFRDDAGRLDLTLAPTHYVMRKRSGALVIASDLRQITGAFRGSVVTDAGERIVLEGDEVIGWAEEHVARW